MLRPACLLPPKGLLTSRSARRVSTTNRDLLPGTPVPTRTGLPPVSLDQLSGRNIGGIVAVKVSAPDGFRPGSQQRGETRQPAAGTRGTACSAAPRCSGSKVQRCTGSSRLQRHRRAALQPATVLQGHRTDAGPHATGIAHALTCGGEFQRGGTHQAPGRNSPAAGVRGTAGRSTRLAAGHWCGCGCDCSTDRSRVPQLRWGV